MSRTITVTWREITSLAVFTSVPSSPPCLDTDGVADRGQWVPKFVGQRRQKLILVAVGLG